MSKIKTVKVEFAVDLYVQWLTEHFPQALEGVGGGLAGPGGPLASIAKAATPKQREMMTSGLNRIIEIAGKMKATIAQAGN